MRAIYPSAPEMADLVSQKVLRPAFAFEGEYKSGTVRLWTGVGPLVWDGNTFLGVGNLAGISSMPEDADVRASNVTLALGGISQDDINEALNEFVNGAARKVWLILLNDVQQVEAYTLCVAGRSDVSAIDEGADTSTVTETVESVMVDLNRNRERRYTHEDQQLRYPGDKGFLQVPTIQDWAGTWGSMPIGGGTTGGGAAGGGGYCFSGNVAVKTPDGLAAFSELPRECLIVNRTGTHKAVLLVHEVSEQVIEFAPGKFVTLNHPMLCGEEWKPAAEKYAESERVEFRGMVYNLHVISLDEADQHFILENGDVAHNKMARYAEE